MIIVADLPAIPVRSLERPHAFAAWMSAPIEPRAAADSVLGQRAAPAGGSVADDGGEEAEDEREVAARDPLTGLMQMQASQ